MIPILYFVTAAFDFITDSILRMHDEKSRSLPGLSGTCAQLTHPQVHSVQSIESKRTWYENVGKRQVKSPKNYLRDSGILHRLLTIANRKDLLSHPVAGASWEGFVIEQLLRSIPEGDNYFWATQSGAEIDLILKIHGKSFGFEAKFSEHPTSTRSVYNAIESLNLEHVWMIHPGTRSYRINEKTTALPLTMIGSLSF